MLADYLADLLSKDGNKLVELLPGPQEIIGESASIEDFRTARSENRPLITSPGHLFKSGDRNDFRSLLNLLLGSGGVLWFYVYAAPSHTTLLIGDRIEVWSPKKGMRNELGRYLVPSRAA